MMEKTEREARITMNVLAALERGKGQSQRDLSKELGIALGLTNAYVKKCVQQGFIMPSDAVSDTPSRSAYTLTQKGYLEKSRLTARFLRSSLSLYQEARSACRDQIQAALNAGMDGFIFTGRGVLSEIALLTLLEFDNIRLSGVYVEDASLEPFLQQPVVHDLTRIGKTDAVIFTEINQPLDMYRRIRDVLPEDRILMPHLLRNAVSAAQQEFLAA